MLKIRRFAKTLRDTEIADRVVAPVNGAQNIGDRHDFDAVDSQIRQVRKLPDSAIEVVSKLADHQLINNGILERRRLPCSFIGRKCVRRTSNGDRRQAADTNFAGERIDDEVDVAARGAVNDIAIDVTPELPER